MILKLNIRKINRICTTSISNVFVTKYSKTALDSCGMCSCLHFKSQHPERFSHYRLRSFYTFF